MNPDEGTTGGGGPQPDAPPRASDSVQRGVECGACGYDLRGLPPAGRCPECGQSIADARLAVHARRRWFGQLADSLWAITFGVLLLIPALLGDLIASATGPDWSAADPLFVSIELVFAAAGVIVILLGATEAASAPPRTLRFQPPAWLRHLVQANALVLLVMCLHSLGCVFAISLATLLSATLWCYARGISSPAPRKLTSLLTLSGGVILVIHLAGDVMAGRTWTATGGVYIALTLLAVPWLSAVFRSAALSTRA